MSANGYATTDLCDAYGDAVIVCEPLFRDFGGRPAFHGPIVTVRTFEDNTLFRHLLDTPGDGRVIVVDGGGSMRCALMGGMLARRAADNGWAGILINGCVRDSAEIAPCAVGVKALGLHPRRSNKDGVGAVDVPVKFAGVTFVPGMIVYADRDGVVVSERPLDPVAAG